METTRNLCWVQCSLLFMLVADYLVESRGDVCKLSSTKQ